MLARELSQATISYTAALLIESKRKNEYLITVIIGITLESRKTL